MSQDFDWNDAKDDLIVPSTQAVAVYLNTAGNIVIRQERDWNGDDDTFVVVPISAGQKLIEKLQELMAEAKGS
jgi:hypothetical protein